MTLTTVSHELETEDVFLLKPEQGRALRWVLSVLPPKLLYPRWMAELDDWAPAGPAYRSTAPGGGWKVGRRYSNGNVLAGIAVWDHYPADYLVGQRRGEYADIGMEIDVNEGAVARRALFNLSDDVTSSGAGGIAMVVKRQAGEITCVGDANQAFEVGQSALNTYLGMAHIALDKGYLNW